MGKLNSGLGSGSVRWLCGLIAAVTAILLSCSDVRAGDAEGQRLPVAPLDPTREDCNALDQEYSRILRAILDRRAQCMRGESRFGDGESCSGYRPYRVIRETKAWVQCSPLEVTLCEVYAQADAQSQTCKARADLRAERERAEREQVQRGEREERQRREEAEQYHAQQRHQQQFAEQQRQQSADQQRQLAEQQRQQSARQLAEHQRRILDIVQKGQDIQKQIQALRPPSLEGMRDTIIDALRPEMPAENTQTKKDYASLHDLAAGGLLRGDGVVGEIQQFMSTELRRRNLETLDRLDQLTKDIEAFVPETSKTSPTVFAGMPSHSLGELRPSTPTTDHAVAAGGGEILGPTGSDTLLGRTGNDTSEEERAEEEVVTAESDDRVGTPWGEPQGLTDDACARDERCRKCEDKNRRYRENGLHSLVGRCSPGEDTPALVR